MRLWSERELDLAGRAEVFGLELRRDDDGCYWLGYIGWPDMRDIGPYNLDEINDSITAAENGFSREQTEEYMADQRWRRIHPELYEGEE